MLGRAYLAQGDTVEARETLTRAEGLYAQVAVSWVLATAPLGSAAERVQDLLADLAEFATALEQGLGVRLRKES